MHYMVKVCKYIYLRRRKNRWSCSAGRLLPAVAGASVLRWAARWSTAGSFTPAAVCASAIGILKKKKEVEVVTHKLVGVKQRFLKSE